MSIYSYKCPNCSASLRYNPNEKEVTCDYCKASFTKDEIDKYIENNPDKIIEEKSSVEYKSSTDDINNKIDEDIRLKGYTCSNCAAEVVTTDTTMATFCYYCHSPVVLTDRASGEFKPDLIIPFKMDKENATEKFLRWAGNKRYVPSDFTSKSHLEKITGMYLPYWSVDVTFDADIYGVGTRTRTTRSGNTEITHNDKYEIQKKGLIEFHDVNEPAYSKVNRQILDSISPYDMTEAENFSFYYLNGFFSEIYDIEQEKVKANIDRRVEEYKEYTVRDLFSGYSKYDINKKNIELRDKVWSYALFPTWMLTYNYKDKIYVYTMNGQTGEAFGELPFDNGKLLKDAVTTGIIVFILALIGGYFIW